MVQNIMITKAFVADMPGQNPQRTCQLPIDTLTQQGIAQLQWQGGHQTCIAEKLALQYGWFKVLLYPAVTLLPPSAMSHSKTWPETTVGKATLVQQLSSPQTSHQMLWTCQGRNPQRTCWSAIDRQTQQDVAKFQWLRRSPNLRSSSPAKLI